MSLYEASVALHVAAALVGFGVTFAYPVILLVAERAGAERIPAALETILVLSDRVAVPGALVVGATGVHQALAGPYGDDAWLLVSAGLYVAVFVAAAAYLRPALARAREVAGNDPGGYAAAIRGPKLVGGLVATTVLVILLLMEVKP